MATLSLVLNDPAARQVREVWADLETRFGLTGVRAVPFPHLTLMGFEGLAHAQIKNLMERISQSTAPFLATTSGIGLFDEPARVIYAPVIRTPSLHNFHRVLHEEIRDLGGVIPDHFSTHGWVPHITLAQGDAPPAVYGRAVERLLDQKFSLTFEVRNLTLFMWIGPRYEPCDRFPFLGRAAEGPVSVLPTC